MICKHLTIDVQSTFCTSQLKSNDELCIGGSVYVHGNSDAMSDLFHRVDAADALQLKAPRPKTATTEDGNAETASATAAAAAAAERARVIYFGDHILSDVQATAECTPWLAGAVVEELCKHLHASAVAATTATTSVTTTAEVAAAADAVEAATVSVRRSGVDMMPAGVQDAASDAVAGAKALAATTASAASTATVTAASTATVTAASTATVTAAPVTASGSGAHWSFSLCELCGGDDDDAVAAVAAAHPPLPSELTPLSSHAFTAAAASNEYLREPVSAKWGSFYHAHGDADLDADGDDDDDEGDGDGDGDGEGDGDGNHGNHDNGDASAPANRPAAAAGGTMLTSSTAVKTTVSSYWSAHLHTHSDVSVSCLSLFAATPAGGDECGGALTRLTSTSSASAPASGAQISFVAHSFSSDTHVHAE